jgi:hypothetical protein
MNMRSNLDLGFGDRFFEPMGTDTPVELQDLGRKLQAAAVDLALEIARAAIKPRPVVSAARQPAKTLVAERDTFARLELQIAMTDHLFSPPRRTGSFRRGENRKPKKEGVVAVQIPGVDGSDGEGTCTVERLPEARIVRREVGDIKLEYWLPRLLTDAHESVFLAAVSVIGEQGGLFADQATGDAAAAITRLAPWAKVAPGSAFKVTSVYEIARRAGFGDSGRAYQMVREKLDDLKVATLVLKTQDGSSSPALSLLTSWQKPGAGGKPELVVAAHPRIAASALGITDARFARIQLNERRRLRMSEAKIIHRWLAAKIWLKEDGFNREIFYLDTLAAHIWSDDEAPGEKLKRERRRKVRAAIENIGELPGWSVAFQGRGEESQAIISRVAPEAVCQAKYGSLPGKVRYPR